MRGPRSSRLETESPPDPQSVVMLRTLLPQSTAFACRSVTHLPSLTGKFSRFTPGMILFSLSCLLAALLGCHHEEPIRTYIIPTDIPRELLPGQERMLGAIVPQEDQSWFFKVMGPEAAIATVASTLREFVSAVEFVDGKPDLSELPAGWQLAGEKPFRFASINIETPEKQLDLSVSSLSRQEDWDREVESNVNRWRGQLGLDPSTENWAGAEPIDVAATEAKAVWVDLVGESTTGSGSGMMPPMMGSTPSMAPTASAPPTTTSPPSDNESPQSRFKFVAPESWREGKMSSMRWAAFNVGPEEAVAEVTVIPAGGDDRGNVQRWIGQIRSDVSEEIVDEAMKEAETIEVAGRQAQRFALIGDEAVSSEQVQQAIDAIIVPLEPGFSLFIKMTGPASTVTAQHEAMTSFLETLEF